MSSEASAPPGHAFIEHQWIPMSDGVRLSATGWIPRGEQPVPALLEIIPYRKRDHTAARDHVLHTWLADRGYACWRVDMRGHGDSEGLHDAHRTYQDVEEILAWMRQQPWCSGRLGMVGLSWGGMNAFMAVSRGVPGLDAVVTTASSYDRYGVGMMWKNGCLLNENFGWATSMAAFSTRPPDPLLHGDGWRAIWMDRLQGHQPEVTNLLGRQRRDDYWDKHLAVSPAEWRTAVLMFSGWADNNYAQTPPELAGQLRSRAIVLGPWGHRYPHFGFPGPAIDFHRLAKDWFDTHLGGASGALTGATLFVPRDLPAMPLYDTAPGEWRSFPDLPAPQAMRSWWLGEGQLRSDAPATGDTRHRTPLSMGSASGEVMPWFAVGPGPELPADQREDDARSLCFVGEVLAQDVAFIGRPVLEVDVSVDRPVAQLVVRLCDVKPDGASARVSLGLFNLNQRPEVGGSQRTPVALEPGRTYRLRLELDYGAYAFAAGHRIRLALSTSYWPLVWPSPEPVTLTVARAASQLHLPLAPDRGSEISVPELGRPPPVAPLPKKDLVPPSRRREVTRDLVAGVTRMVIAETNGPYVLPQIDDWTVRSSVEEQYAIRDDDPLSASVAIAWEWQYGRSDWSVRTQVRSKLRSDAQRFHCELSLAAFEGDRQVFANAWTHTFPRDFI
jgi:putative CocE/NonD family hydrolase